MAFDPNSLFYYMVQKYQENKTEDNKIIFCNEGSSRCFSHNQLVRTSKGSKQIKDINKRDYVLTYNESTKEKEYKKVNRIFKFDNKKKMYKITLKNGRIIECTYDHEFYYKGEWQTIESIIRLIDYGTMERNT